AGQRTGNPTPGCEVGNPVSYLPTRLVRAAERGGTITFLSDGPDGGQRVEWADLPALRDRHPGRVAGRGHRGGVATADADELAGGFRGPDPRPGPGGRHLPGRGRPDAGRLHPARAGRSPGGPPP